MAAEAEHVRPRGQPQVLELGEPAEAQACGDVAAGVVADGQVGEPVGRGEAAVEGAGAFGGLGGVLGHVASDLGVGHVAVGGDRADVELAAPRQRAGREPRRGGRGDADGAGRLVDGGGEQAIPCPSCAVADEDRPFSPRWGVTGPNNGAVSVTKTHGWSATRGGNALAASQPGAVDLGAGRAAGGAAGLQAMEKGRTPPGSWTVVYGGSVRRSILSPD